MNIKTKTQIILKTKRYEYNVEEIADDYIDRNAYFINMKIMKNSQYAIPWDIAKFIEEKEVIKSHMDEKIHFEAEGFVCGKVNKVIDKESNETFIFTDSLIETEEEFFVKKFIYEHENNNEEIDYHGISRQIYDVVEKKFKKK